MMEIARSQFQQLMFQTAFCLMCCDGHIDEREIAEIKALSEGAVYFKDIDLDPELNRLLASLKTDANRIVTNLFEMLKAREFSPIQELLILEISLRIVNADKKIEDNEKRFLSLLRSHLRLSDKLILDRFGHIELLFPDGLETQEDVKLLSVRVFDDFSSVTMAHKTYGTFETFDQ